MSLYTRGNSRYSRPIDKGNVFNTSVDALTNIFDTDLTPSSTPTFFRIYCSFTQLGILIVARTRGGVTRTEEMNEGQNLIANSAYIFEIHVSYGDTINIQHSNGTNNNINYLTVFELPSSS